MKRSFLFTSESVSEGHPDKVCDRISDMVVDTYLAKDASSRVGCETLTTTNKVVLAGEVRGPSISKEEIISKVRNRYPNVYKVLIKERDELMAHKLFNLMWHKPNKRIVAVVGAGHEDRILKLIKDAFKSME